MASSRRKALALLQAAEPITEAFFRSRKTGRQNTVPIGAVDFASLNRHAERTGGVIRGLGRCNPYNAIVFETADDDELLFANPESDSYRDYVSVFTKESFSMDALTGYSDVNVDHVASRSGARQRELAYVALVSIHKDANQSYSAVEAALSDPPNKDGLVFPNIFQIMKINGVALDQRQMSAGGISKMVDELVGQSLVSPADAEWCTGLGLRAMQRIQRRLT